ncbi:MAG: hypothetical protein ACFCVG_09975 [Kineosporiaceae bacterium]
MAEPLDSLWSAVLAVSRRLDPERWLLIGGQMVLLHGIAGDRPQPRVTRDIDVMADLVAHRHALADCVRVLRDLGLEPRPDSGGRVYRFAREVDGVTVDLVAPDHTPPRRSLRTAAGGDTIAVDGGHQALSRREILLVTGPSHPEAVPVPVPDLLGAVVLKAAAWAVDSRDRQRHSGDAAFLVSLMSDPLAERARFAGSDRRRLLRLNSRLGDRSAAEWRAVGDHAADGYATWQLLIQG